MLLRIMSKFEVCIHVRKFTTNLQGIVNWCLNTIITMDKKRERGKNYTDKEKETLLEIVSDFGNVIENKQTDGASVKLKNEAWEAISELYNSTSQTGVRSASQLKLLYDSIKKKAKKDKANEKVQIYKTGGGSGDSKIDAIGEKFLALNSQSATKEIRNVYDSDAPFDILLETGQGNDTAQTDTFEEMETHFEEVVTRTTDVPHVSEGQQQHPKQETAVLRPGVPYHRKADIKKYSKEDKENLKLDIMRVRKEKEELSRDILKLEKRKLELDIQERILKLKKEYGSEFSSD